MIGPKVRFGAGSLGLKKMKKRVKRVNQGEVVKITMTGSLINSYKDNAGVIGRPHLNHQFFSILVH